MKQLFLSNELGVLGLGQMPRCSMYGIFTYIYPQNYTNVKGSQYHFEISPMSSASWIFQSKPALREVTTQNKLGQVVVSNIFIFTPTWGKIPILTNVFQLG